MTASGAWWAAAWSSAISNSLTGAAELEAGARLVRRTALGSPEIVPGSIELRDPGGRWVAHLGVEPLSDRQWDAVVGAVAADARLTAEVITGNLPVDLHGRTVALGCPLTPERRNLGVDCSCPDWQEPCRHVGAIVALVAEMLATDPWLVTAMRGRTRDQIVETVRAHRAGRLGIEPSGDTPRGSDPGVDAAATFRRPDRPRRLPSPLAALRRPGQPVPFRPPPVDAGIAADDLDHLVADAAERAFQLLSGDVTADALLIDESEDRRRIDDVRRRRTRPDPDR